MENSVFRKGLVIGIIVCFVGASLIPNIYGKIISNTNNENLKYNTIDNDDPEYYAIIAACSQYKNESHSIPPPPLRPIPEELFKQLYNSLLNADNWDEIHIILLLNENATKKNITNALRDTAAIIKPQDIFLFFWFGHGTLIPDEDGDEALINPDDKYDEAICPYDTGTASDMLSDDELDFYFSNINAKGMCLAFEQF